MTKKTEDFSINQKSTIRDNDKNNRLNKRIKDMFYAGMNLDTIAAQTYRGHMPDTSSAEVSPEGDPTGNTAQIASYMAHAQ